MASLPITPTLCALTYDTDYGRKTPYRYPCWMGRNVVSSPPETTFSLPSSGCSVSYLEYLRALYESKAISTPKSAGHHGSGAGGHLSRSPHTFHTTANQNSYAVSYGYIDNRPKTAFIPHGRPIEPHQQYSLPSVHHGRGWGPEIEEEESDSEEEYEERLVWVDALNRWIPDPQLPPRNYLTFVGTAPVEAKLYASLKEQHLGKDDVEGRGRFCSRYETHMDSHRHTDKCGLCGQFHEAFPQSLDHVHTQRLVTLQRREALLKKRASDAEEKKQRKAYSTPLYTPAKDKRQKVRFSAPESLGVSLVTTPVSDADPDMMSLPKESWDALVQDKRDETTESQVTGEDTDGLGVPGALDSEDKEVSAEDLGYVVVTLEDIQEATEALEAHEAAKLAEMEAKEKADAKLAWALEMQKKQQLLKAEQAEKERLAALAAAAAREEEEKARLAKSLRGVGAVGRSETGALANVSSKSSSDKTSTSSVSGSGSLHKKMSAAVTRSSKSVTKSSSTKLGKKSSSKLKVSPSKDGVGVSDVQNTKTEQSKAAAVKSTKQADGGEITHKPQSNIDAASFKVESSDNPKSSGPANGQIRSIPSISKPDALSHKGAGAAPDKGARTKVTKDQSSGTDNGTILGRKDHSPLTTHMDMSINKHEPIPFSQNEPQRGGDIPDAPATQAIPTVGDTHVGPLSLTVDQQERPSSRKSPAERQRRVAKIKRERVGQRRKKEDQSETEAPAETRKTESWIYDDDDFSEKIEKQKEDTKEIEILDLTPDLPDPDSYKSCAQTGHSNKRRTAIQTPIVQKLNNKLRRRPFVKDTSYEEELRRQELAERRRQKHMEMLEKMKAKQANVGWGGEGGEDGPNFEDYGFLAKYCIFNKSNIEMYRHTFDVVDEERRRWLSGSDVMVALRAVNNKLSESEENYMYRLLEMIGYNVKNGADFKLFSVMAALSQKISALDNWMKNMIGRMDFKMLEMKMFMCKKLWECNVDPGTNKITIDQLCVELRAGGVSNQHEAEVRQKLSHMDDLDLLDFLTYIPLFIMIHQSVVDNPLDDVRNK